MNPLALALQGVGFGVAVMALQGFSAIDVLMPQVAADSTGYNTRIRRSRHTVTPHPLPMLKRSRQRREAGDFFVLFKP